MPDLAAWVFHSPRRLLAVVVALLLVVVGVAAAVQASRGSAEPAAPVVAGAGGVADAAAATQAAVSFADAWASTRDGESADAWRTRVSALATPDLARGLAFTDPAALPGGRATGTPVVRFASIASSLVEVPLTSGRRVLVTVVLLGGHWLASDVQPLAGNAGDVAGAAVSRSAPASGSGG